MNAISFDYPWALLGFLVFIPLLLWDFFSARRKKIYENLPKNLKTQLAASRVFFKIFLACVIAALSGPRWGIGPSALSGESLRAVDAVIALDVSRSMELHDGQGAAADTSRLERGLAIVREAVAAVPGMRFGAAVSRNKGIVAVPLTWDSDAVLAFLDAAGSSLTGRGTNLESLVDAAAGAFQSSYPSTRVILLVSDGEALSGSLGAALSRCKRDGILVSSIAVGSDEGGMLDDGILSRRNPRAMRIAAGQTGGLYIDGNREDAAAALVGHLLSLAPGSETRGTQTERTARWFMFVMLAIMAFGASKLSLLRLGSGE
jgi:Ca-activated chloride channel family protein